MGKLSLAARNYSVQLPEVQALVSSGVIGSDTDWSDGWIFDSFIPNRFLDNKSEKACIVFTQGNWMEPNEHNTAQFPLLTMDIWAAPKKDSDNSVEEYNADDIIETVFDAIRPYFHLIHNGVPGNSSDAYISYLGQPGLTRRWGTAEQIADRSGYPILTCKHIGTGDFADVSEGNGARFRSHTFGIQTV